MEQRISMINIRIKKFKEFLDEFAPLFNQENFNYNLLESQFESIRNRNKKAQEELNQLEIKIKESVGASEKIIADAREEERKIRADNMVLYHKAKSKYKEIEESLSKVEKKQVQEHLDKMGALATV